MPYPMSCTTGRVVAAGGCTNAGIVVVVVGGSVVVVDVEVVGPSGSAVDFWSSCRSAAPATTMPPTSAHASARQTTTRTVNAFRTTVRRCYRRADRLLSSAYGPRRMATDLSAVPRRSRRRSRAGAAFRADVEGLRGLAVLLVVLFHADVPGFHGG